MVALSCRMAVTIDLMLKKDLVWYFAEPFVFQFANQKFKDQDI